MSNKNIEFAIYFIPEGAIYNLGSQIIGYDIKKKLVTKNTSIEELPNNNAAHYGFHLTLTDVVQINANQLSKVLKLTKAICKISVFKNISIKLDKMGIMPNANVYALQFKNSIKLWILHVFLVIFVQRLGTGSGYKHNVNMSAWRRVKTRHFLSPYIFDDFLPHISLASDVDRNTANKLHELINKKLPKLSVLKIGTIAVVVRRGESKYFEILETIKLGD